MTSCFFFRSRESGIFAIINIPGKYYPVEVFGFMLADLNQVPKFDVLLTDYGTGKRATNLLAAASVDGYHVDEIHMLLRLYLVVSGEQVLIFGTLDALYVF